MSTFREAMFHLVGITEDDLDTPHVDEYDGDTFTTPSLIDHDDGKETRNIGEEA